MGWDGMGWKGIESTAVSGYEVLRRDSGRRADGGGRQRV